MTRVYCWNNDCVYCDEGICCAGCITVGENSTYGCDEYQCYLDTEEYGEEYWVLIGDKGKPIGREKRNGKKIVYEDRVFYTDAKSLDDYSTFVTDAKTGLAVKYSMLKEHWERVLEIAEKQPDIESFPIVEKGEDGKYHIEKGGEG